MNLKFFLSVFLFLLCLQNSFGQIASYSFEGNLNDQIASQNGFYNPESCCDLFGSDHCSKFTTKLGQSVCALPKVVGAGNFISEAGNQSLHLDSFEYVKLPSEVNEQIDKDKSFSVDFKFKIPSESWADEIENENYIPVQKATINKSPLIEWIWLLILAIIALATEWFTRKYNGLL